jgi:hypothetical protein
MVEMNKVGKFELRRIMKEFDDTLISLFGVNMLDAKINRYDALDAYNEFQSASKAAEMAGLRRGLKLLATPESSKPTKASG